MAFVILAQQLVCDPGCPGCAFACAGTSSLAIQFIHDGLNQWLVDVRRVINWKVFCTCGGGQFDRRGIECGEGNLPLLSRPVQFGRGDTRC